MPYGEALTDAVGRLEQVAPGYLEQVRRATSRLVARRSGPSGDPRDALAELEEAAAIDVEVPTLARRRAVRLVKVGVRALVGWYMRYVGQQVTALGQSTARLGAALVEASEDLSRRGEDLSRRTDGLATEVEALAARVGRLEGDR